MTKSIRAQYDNNNRRYSIISYLKIILFKMT